jgi:HAD superfamily hydrolase (TIGR01509 family)
MMERLIATLFDYNGVLVDDEDVHFAAFREALRPLGIALTQEEYLARYLGFDDAGAFRAILEDAGRKPTPAEIDALVEAKKPLYLARIDRVQAFPGAKEAIKRRATHGPVAIVSGALRQEIELGLEMLGVAKLVKVIVSAEDAPQCKPDPQGYLLAMTKLHEAGFEGHAVVIEDSIAGVEAAKRAGLRCVAVAHTYAAFELSRAGADAVAPSLAQLDDTMLE